MFNRILCAIDFDGNSLDALRLSRRLALKEEATLCVLHVVTPTDPTVISAPIIAQRHENNARTELRRIEREELAGINHEGFVRFGHPAPEIIAAIRDITPDLVVMATHGRVGVSHFLLGSVTEKVVRESPVPVLTIRQRGLSKQSVAA